MLINLALILALFTFLPFPISAYPKPASAAAEGSRRWYDVAWHPGPASLVTEFSGTMVVPKLPRAAAYYLFPALQVTDDSSIFQNVLDGRKGSWWLANGWYSPKEGLPWGGGFSTKEGDTNSFKNKLLNSTHWESTIVHGGTGEAVTNQFEIAYKKFDEALVTIELYGVTWDFGPLTFKDLTIRAKSVDKKETSTTWCTNPLDFNTDYTLTGAKTAHSPSGRTVTCSVDMVVMNKPRT